MSDKPVFIYAATYADQADALADYDSLIELHQAKLVGTYDVAPHQQGLSGQGARGASTRSPPSTVLGAG